ncbi:pyruvate dehydrogenase (acetyl-transferring) E1 component subunit alpha [Aestuariimicrobium ganziense]|uniref:pyruvate dehydrogenase (acetyl-transferring) E1 component subunit alpha n=1 Tax=Aestuariimicrobium ganziense TaxID=2773677 RepID=UPI00194299B0|nr:pyruvate dehydrogenase (acetyl-transferring) E1 component subunit alpha [Aestuariimicrobium ganziense]
MTNLIGHPDHGSFERDPQDMVQLLTPEGERVEHPDFAWCGDDDLAKQLLRDMVLARRFDVEGTNLQRHGELGVWPPALGQEAAQVGAAHAMRAGDHVFPTYREHVVCLLRGVTPADMLGIWRGTTQSAWDTVSTNTHMYTLVIGAQTLHATGYAMGLQLDGMVGNDDPERNAGVLAFHGDGASSQGDVNESYVFAASYHAPVVFFCQNNQWAISEPITRQTTIPLYQRAMGFGFPGVRVDGNDVLAVHAVTSWAMERARQGQGPAFIEAFTYRMGAHTTADDPTKYRLAEETEHWRLKDPIERLRAHLLRSGKIDDAWLAELDDEAEQFGAEVRAACHALPVPKFSEIFATVHAESTAELEAQREQYQTWADSFESIGADSHGAANGQGVSP